MIVNPRERRYDMIKSRNNFIILILSVLTFLFTFYVMILPADSKSNALVCETDEHVHTEACFTLCEVAGETVLICEPCNGSQEHPDERIVHVHDKFCYINMDDDGNGLLICPMAEYSHVHDENCYDAEQTLICGMITHQHDPQCFRTVQEADLHGDSPAEVLICGKQVHIHTLECQELNPERFTAERLQTDLPADPMDTQADDPELQENPAEYAIQELAYEDDGFYPYQNSNAPPVSRIASNALDMTDYITDVALCYKGEASGEWIEITGDHNTDLPANREYRIDVSYRIDNLSTLGNYDNQLILRDSIPSWITPTDTNFIYDDEVAGLIAVRDGSLTITFQDSFMSSHQGTLTGSFYVYGNADWHKVNPDGEEINLPGLDITMLYFEGDLPQKYGKVMLEKSVEDEIIIYNSKNYLKYTLTVRSLEDLHDIPGVTVRDAFTENSRFVNCYAEITGNPLTLGNQESGVMPYETRTDDAIAGKIILDNLDNSGNSNNSNNQAMLWDIGTLQANETRILTYYAELSDDYTGAEARGTISNQAELFAGEIPKDTAQDSFTPVANLDVTKEVLQSSDTPQIDETGSGTLRYQVRVVSWANNSYPLKNVRLSDVIDQRYKNFIDHDAEHPVTANIIYQEIENNDIIEEKLLEENATLAYNPATGQFSYTIPTLDAGDAVVLTYEIRLKHILTAENTDIQFRNQANIYLDGNRSGNGTIFKTAFVDYTIQQSSWIRKISGLSLESDLTVKINNHNSGNPESFTVPRNSRQYQIIVNEGGAWDLSSATLHDNFRQINGMDYMAYTGFLRLDEFDLADTDRTAIRSESDSQAISRLMGLTPTRTIWVDIDGKTEFDLRPTDYGLDAGKHTYLLTYYATPRNVEHIGSISVTNEFTIYGNIGNGITLGYPGILCAVSNTVSGAIHYNAQKMPWYLTTNPSENGTLEVESNYTPNGALYWIVKIDGTVNAGFSIEDIPVNDRQGYTNHVFCPDSVAGVFRAPKDLDIPEIYSTYGELLTDSQNTQNIEKLSGNQRNFLIGQDALKFKYIQTDITDISQLDGKSYVIANINGNYKATMGDAQAVNGITHGITTGTSLNIVSSQWVAGSHIMGMPSVTWTFQRIQENQFYITSNGKYLNINTDSTGKVTLSDSPVALTVTLSENYPGQIRISNNKNYYLTWAGITGDNNMFSAWGGAGENSRQFSMLERVADDYLWTSQNGYQATITFQKDIPLNSDEALYVIIRTVNQKAQDKTSKTNNRYGNQFQINDIIQGTTGVLSQVEYTHRLAGSVLKTGESAYYYDAGTGDWSVAYADGNLNRLNQVWDDSGRLSLQYDCDGKSKDTSVKEYLENMHGTGTYAEWYVQANWDGTLSNTVDLCDTLPENFEPVCVTLYNWTATQTKDPAYPVIPELDGNGDWQKRTHTISASHANWGKKPFADFNYYYNPKTNQVRWRIENLVGEGDSDPDGLQNYNNSLGFLVICKVKDPDILMNGTGTIAENAVTIQSDSFTDSDRDILCINGGTSLRKYFELGDIVSKSGNNMFEISGTKIPFVIEVNPQAERLSTDGTLPPLIDILGDGLTLDASSIRITYLDDPDHPDGIDIPGCACVVDGQKLTITGLPDQTAIRITYKAKLGNLDKTHTEAEISNLVYWDGYDQPAHPQIEHAKMQFTMGGEIQLSDHPMLTIIKTEQGNSAKFLAGAEFELLDSDHKLLSTGKTDSDGKLSFYMDQYQQTYLLDYGKTYYLREINAPSGYELDPEEKCIEIPAKENTYEDDFEYEFENAKKTIRLEKIFADVPASQIHGSYSFGIYEGNNLSSEPVQILTITYPNSNNPENSANPEPVYRLDGVIVRSPEFTCAKPGMAYYVYELCDGKPVTNGDTASINNLTFEVSYPDANQNYVSLTANSITITNRLVIYEMPETGGMGTAIYYLISLPVLVTAIILLMKKSKTSSF